MLTVFTKINLITQLEEEKGKSCSFYFYPNFVFFSCENKNMIKLMNHKVSTVIFYGGGEKEKGQYKNLTLSGTWF